MIRHRHASFMDHASTAELGLPADASSPPHASQHAMTIEEELALHGTMTLQLLAGGVRPARWGTPAFIRELALVRGHLSLIGDRRLLAASFGRESFRDRGGQPSVKHVNLRLRASAVHLAYALRWLELGEGADPCEVASGSERFGRRIG